MKKTIITLLALTAISWWGCEDMNERHQKYLDEGEVVYIGKADSVKAFNGYERIKLQWQVSKDPKLKSVSIYWNNRKDSASVEIDRTKGNKMEALIPISEGKYNFELEGRSDDGGRSITTFASANSYGADFQGTLYNRVALSQKVVDDSLLIEWGLTSNSVGMFMEYTNRDGKAVKLFVEDKTTQTKIGDFSYSTKSKPAVFTLSTLYIPDDYCFDTVRTVPGANSFPKAYTAMEVDVSKWTVISTSNFSKPASNMLDNNASTWWECEYPKWGPFTIIFEMDQTQQFDEFWVATNKPTFIKDVKVSYAMKNEESAWIYYGSYLFTKQSDPEKLSVKNSVNAARFIKLEINNREDPQATISDIGIIQLVEVE